MKLLKVLACVLLTICCLIAAYFAYAYLAYQRIADQQKLTVNANTQLTLKSEQALSLLTYNIGYGSYPPDYTFFMDGGTEVLARSRSSVLELLNGSIGLIKTYSPDIILLQEVDIKGRRSHNVKQTAILERAFGAYDSFAAINYDSPFLFYPLTEPFGQNRSALMTFSRYKIATADRRSLPVATDFNKFFDLDRCYTVAQLPVDNGKKLYIYNLHLTAFGGNPTIRDAQVRMLAADMAEKLQGGNYIVCGGDFNHDILQNSVQYFNGPQASFEWAQPFPEQLLPAQMRLSKDYSNDKLSPTVRNLDKPYIPGQSTVMIIDGFFVSDNLEVLSVQNVNNNFIYSDHNPVLLKIKLKR